MGTAIKATAVSTDQAVSSSIEHAAIAANDCMARAGIEPDQIDVLINTGVYRDSNMVEPAMSSLIQKEIGMSLDYLTHPNSKAGFSFDLMNGACGVLNAIQAGGAFLDSGNAEYLLIVSSDAHPSNESRADFPYATLGAAMLVERIPDADRGFGRVHTEESSQQSPGAEGYTDMAEMGVHGREVITVHREPDYAARLADFAASTARSYAGTEGIDLQRCLLVTSHPTPSFAADVTRRLGISEQAAVAVEGVDGDPHSSAPILGYHQAVVRGQDTAADTVLFLTAGAGITSACAVYRRPEDRGF